MKAFSFWNFVSPILLIGIIVYNVPRSEALTPLETCQLVKNGSFVGDPSNCQNWYYCLNGAAIAGTCKTGFLFNSYTGSCDYPANVVCAANVTTMCKGLNAVYKRDPNSCQGYCYCTNGATECTNCPTGQVFDLATTSCVWATEDVLCESDSPCLLAPNAFIKNPNSCAGWYRCLNGEIVKDGNCDNDLYYDAFNGMCNYPSVVGCNIVTTAPTTVTPTPLLSCPTGVTALKNFYSDDDSCRGYYYCVTDPADSSKAISSWAQCPKGSQFSFSTQQCTNPYNVSPVCTQNRCEGMSVSFMAAKGCSRYYICPNGRTTDTSYPCPEKHPFFDEKSQACVEDQPQLKICDTS